MTIHEKLVTIQKTLKAPKTNKNSFGNYSYRSCEDIVEAVKPLLDGCTLTINDEIVNVGERYYVKATATITMGGESISTTAFAREPEEKKGMDLAQLTGATSSYARKYALNGLFAIDDTRDADAMDNRHTEVKMQAVKEPEWIEDDQGELSTKITNDTKMNLMIALPKKGKDINDLYAFMQKAFKVSETSDLTEAQGQKLLTKIQALPDKESK